MHASDKIVQLTAAQIDEAIISGLENALTATKNVAHQWRTIDLVDANTCNEWNSRNAKRIVGEFCTGVRREYEQLRRKSWDKTGTRGSGRTLIDVLNKLQTPIFWAGRLQDDVLADEFKGYSCYCLMVTATGKEAANVAWTGAKIDHTVWRIANQLRTVVYEKPDAITQAVANSSTKATPFEDRILTVGDVRPTSAVGEMMREEDEKFRKRIEDRVKTPFAAPPTCPAPIPPFTAPPPIIVPKTQTENIMATERYVPEEQLYQGYIDSGLVEASGKATKLESFIVKARELSREATTVVDNLVNLAAEQRELSGYNV